MYTPTEDPDARLLVMYWVHGGSLTTGSGGNPIYDGSALARKGAVVVSVNCRLGLRGALAGDPHFEGDVCNGNRVFLDQVADLEWVQENIRAFGGDPGNATIFGESVGGTSVVSLLASPRSEGFYQRAIIQSGAADMNACSCTGQRPGNSFADASASPCHDGRIPRKIKERRNVDEYLRRTRSRVMSPASVRF